MPTVLLENKTKRPQRMLVLNLTKMTAPYKVMSKRTHETKNGDRSYKVVAHNVPGSVRIPAGSSLEVDAEFLKCPSVRAAIARHELSATPVSVKSPAPASVPQEQLRRRTKKRNKKG
jgi:hypothetical protein